MNGVDHGEFGESFKAQEYYLYVVNQFRKELRTTRVEFQRAQGS